MNLSTQIRLGFALMLTLMLIAGGLSVYNAHKLNEAAENLEGRYSTLYKLFTNPSFRSWIRRPGSERRWWSRPLLS